MDMVDISMDHWLIYKGRLWDLMGISLIIWVILITTSLFLPHGKSSGIREIIPFYGGKIQVSELLQFTQIHLWPVVWNMSFIVPYIGKFAIPTDQYFSEG